LIALRDQAASQRHLLASWVDYWEIGNRLAQAQQADLDAFYARWPGTYVEDRLRNDWLLELGRRRDWANFAVEFPRFRMNDDREVTCYALLVEHLNAQQASRALPADFRVRAVDAWNAQRDLDDGCNLMATTLAEARVITAADAWRRARFAAEANRPRVVRAAAALAAPALQAAVAQAIDKAWATASCWPPPTLPAREVWDRCINTSERTKSFIDLEQRFPMPFRDAVVSAAAKSGWTRPTSMA
jgi:soluble lytic murein transglycosylase